jgi:sugar O-acyltransferase (sialic acid O-acetyltransferase NeuD family)
MKKRIVVFGCGEHARMVLDNIEEQGEFEVFGLVTNDDEELHKSILGYEVVCLDNDMESFLSANPDICGYFLGLGDMKSRSKLAMRMDKILKAVNVVHPTAQISKHAKIGEGILLESFTKVANGVVVGNHCIVNSFSAINHDQRIGDNVLIAGNVSMAGRSVGSNTIIADGASIAFKKSVGKCCIVGDGAVVTRDLPDNVIAYGNPARVVRKNDW